MSVCLFHFHTFLFVVNISINLLKNVGNQKVDGSHLLFHPYRLPFRFEGQGLGVRRRGRGKTEKWDSPLDLSEIHPHQ